MLADGSRQERLRKVTVPTLAVQGESDPLALPAHGRAIADAVQNGKFITLPEWGHGIDCPALWPLLTRHLAEFINSHPIFKKC